jgi:hypothetical protein
VQYTAACADQIPRLGVDRQIDVAGPYAGLLIGQALPFVRQRPQAFTSEPPAPHQQRAGPVLAVAHGAGRLDEVAEVDGRGEVGGAALLERRTVQQQLQFTRPVPQLGEHHTAVVADAQHPARDIEFDVVGGVDGRRRGVARWSTDRIGVHAVGL